VFRAERDQVPRAVEPVRAGRDYGAPDLGRYVGDCAGYASGLSLLVIGPRVEVLRDVRLAAIALDVAASAIPGPVETWSLLSRSRLNPRTSPSTPGRSRPATCRNRLRPRDRRAMHRLVRAAVDVLAAVAILASAKPSVDRVDRDASGTPINHRPCALVNGPGCLQSELPHAHRRSDMSSKRAPGSTLAPSAAARP
jgi:hypothetical protein